MHLKIGQTAFYVRVSTDSQDEKMQHSAAKPILESVPEGQLLVFIDHGVSAAKVPMEKRPQLQRMLNLIRSGQIRTLICYERDRLARNPYEYIEIAKLINSLEVEVVFTATSARPYDRNLLVEGIAAIAAYAEAQAIQRRVSDTVKEYPAQLFGYQRERRHDGFVYYVKDHRRAHLIAHMFENMASVTGLVDFLEQFEYHRKLLHRSEAQMFKLMQMPFYAGHVWRFEKYHLLPHVEPITSLEFFEEVQIKIANLVEETGRDLNSTGNEIVQPNCGICGSPMALKTSLGHEPLYQCRRGSHKVNSIAMTVFNETITNAVAARITNLDVEMIRKTCTEFVRKHERKWEVEQARLHKHSKEKILSFARRYAPGDRCKAMEDALNEMDLIESDLSFVSEQLLKLRLGYSIDVVGFVALVQHNLATRMQDKSSIRMLASSLFHKVVVYPDRIELMEYYSRFLRNGAREHGATA